MKILYILLAIILGYGIHKILLIQNVLIIPNNHIKNSKCL